MQDGFIKALTKLGGTYDGDMLPINNTDFSATLIKAKAFKPNVLLNNMGGLTQINCMKQFTQFGMQNEMAPRRRAVRVGKHQEPVRRRRKPAGGTWNGGGISRTCPRS